MGPRAASAGRRESTGSPKPGLLTLKVQIQGWTSMPARCASLTRVRKGSKPSLANSGSLSVKRLG
ncbi:hypothetical protein D3C86_1745570 [compost metagenome]